MELRSEYHRQLRQLAERLVTLGGAVWDNIGRATEALVGRDFGLVDDVIEADDRIDATSKQLTEDAVLVLARQAPVASELQYVVSLLRLAYEIERCGDLMVNVARAAHRLPAELPPGDVRSALASLAEASRRIFEHALDLYRQGNAADLSEEDDEVDDAHTRLLHVLTVDPVDPHVIVALTIAGRCFERVADHAVNLAARSQLNAAIGGPAGPS